MCRRSYRRPPRSQRGQAITEYAVIVGVWAMLFVLPVFRGPGGRYRQPQDRPSACQSSCCSSMRLTYTSLKLFQTGDHVPVP